MVRAARILTERPAQWPPLQDSKNKRKSPLHRRPRHAGRLRGRDGHPPRAVYGRCPGGRRHRHGGFRAFPRSASPSARCSRTASPTWQDVGPEADFNPRPTCRSVITSRAEHRRGRQDHDLRAQVRHDRSPSDEDGSRAATLVAISTRCAHLGCPVRYVQARSASSAPATAASTIRRQGRRRPACAPARPLRHARVERPREVGARFSVQLRARSLHAARPVEPPRRPLAVPLPLEAHRMKLPSPPPPQVPRATPPGERNGKATAPARKPAPPRSRGAREGRSARSSAHRVGRLARRAHRAGPFLRGFLFRKVPKGTNWFYTLGSATMFAFLSQAVTGVFLAMYYGRRHAAYTSIQHINNEVFLGEFVRGMHQWGSTVMMILSSCTWAAHSSSAPTSTRASSTGSSASSCWSSRWRWVHRLPAAVRPAVLLGHDRRREHQRLGPDHRPLPRRLPARRRRFGATTLVALLRDPHAADPGPDRRADRRAPVPGGQARHHGAAVAQGREVATSAKEEI